jgi:hypothetical protein
MVGPSDLGSEHPNGSTVSEISKDVDQRVDKVAIVIAPPQKDSVNYFLNMATNELITCYLDYVLPQCFIGIVSVT